MTATRSDTIAETAGDPIFPPCPTCGRAMRHETVVPAATAVPTTRVVWACQFCRQRDLASITDPARHHDAFVRSALLLAAELGADRVRDLADRVEDESRIFTEPTVSRRRETAIVLRWCV